MDIGVFKLKYKDFLYWIFLICLFQGVISDYLGFRQINYLCDLLLVIVFILKIFKSNRLKLFVCKNFEFFSILFFAVVVILGWIFNSVPLAQALWGVRNYGRFFLFYMLGCSLWTATDIKKMEDFLLKIFPLHILLVAYQYVIEGLRQDFLSGIFGKTGGGNGGLIIYLSVLLCILISRFEYKKISIKKFGIYFLLILVNSALSELKFMFILSIILLIWYLAMARRKGRGMIVALFAMIFLYIGVQILYFVFPYWADYLTVDNILKMISDQQVYATSYDVGRTAVFSKLSPIITEWGGSDSLLWGIGLGNGDYSSAIASLNSLFYLAYEKIHYTWLSLGYLFVETGYLGTLAYVSFFVILEIKAIILFRKKNSYQSFLNSFFPLVFIILIVYNSALRSNFAYLSFAVLTWQMIDKKTNRANRLYSSRNSLQSRGEKELK